VKKLKEIFHGLDRESGVALVLAGFLMTLFAYQGHPDFFIRRFQEAPWAAGRLDFASEAYRFAFAFVFFFLIPAAVVKIVFRRSLADYGLQLGDKKFGFTFVALSLVVLPLPLYLNAGSSDFLEAYPLWKQSCASLSNYGLWMSLYLFYYIGWEFFFRGFMQFSLVGKTAPFIIIMMQTLPSTIIHIGKPEGETLSAVVGGIIFGAVALRTRSILYPLLVHWYVGALTELFTCMRTL
jgi:membrane protease YdiL (CAAX protease family)